MVKRIAKRVVPLVAIVALMLNLVVSPQRARAVAVTAAVAASAAAILTACGVTYWASTQTDAINYIAGKIDDYLTSIEQPSMTYEDWLEVDGVSQLFSVIDGGVMQFTSGVANKLLDFVRWFQNEEGIESGGSVITNSEIIATVTDNGHVGDPPPIINSFLEGSTFTASVQGLFSNSYKFGVQVQIAVPIDDTTDIQLTSRTVSVSTGYYIWVGAYDTTTPNNPQGTGQNYNGSELLVPVALGSQYLVFTIYTTRTTALNLDFSCVVASGSVESPTIAVTPSDFVNIPSNIASDATFAVSPSVSLAAGDSVDTASQAVIDGITSNDGLTSTVEETPGTAWGWLYTLLANIASTIGAGVSDIKDKLDGVKGSADNAVSAAQGAATASQGAATAAQGAASAAQDAATAAQGVETAVEGLQSTAEGIEDNTATIARSLAPATYGDVADYQLDLTSLFPFCIPRDIYTAISLFASDPDAPSIDWDMPLPNGSIYHIHYDLAQWDNVASLLRHLELLLYGVGLMMATKSIIKW